MACALLYHHLVHEEDLPRLPSNLQRRIARAIETRLTVAPERYGTPLRETLKGYWKLRVGDYRIVYKMAGSEVYILGILHRKDIYEKVSHRLEQ